MVGVSKGMLIVKYFCSNKSFSCVSQILLRSQGCCKDEVNVATLSFMDISIFKAVVSVCIYCVKHTLYICLMYIYIYTCICLMCMYMYIYIYILGWQLSSCLY